MMDLRLVFALSLVSFSFAYIPNPCGFSRGVNFRPAGCLTEAKSFCASTVPFYGKRYRYCMALRNPSPPRICTAQFKPVCCTVKQNRYISQTFTSSNACSCDAYNNSRVLFDGECTRPPTRSAVCGKNLNPTCCYIDKFDLTYTAANRCICKKAAGGVILQKSFCKLK